MSSYHEINNKEFEIGNFLCRDDLEELVSFLN